MNGLHNPLLNLAASLPRLPCRFPPEKGRYHLYAALTCPWAHRTLIVHALKVGDPNSGAFECLCIIEVAAALACLHLSARGSYADFHLRGVWELFLGRRWRQKVGECRF
jgi:hypothetical protein